MAREAVKVAGTGRVIRSYTCLDANAIPKHTLLVLSSDPNTVTASGNSSSGAIFAGISIAAKEALDGATTIAADISGQWDITCSGSITIGHKVMLGNGANYVQDTVVTTDALVVDRGAIVGMIMETGGDGVVETIDLDRR